jgi:hypothetical protein
MRSLLGRFHRPFARGVDEQLLLLNNLGDGSTLSLDFTTGVLDPRLTFTRTTNATFINSQGLVEWANSNMYWNTAFEGLSGSNPSLTSSGWGYALSTGGTAVFNGDGSVTVTTTAAERRAIFRSSGFSGGGLRVVASVDVTIASGSLQASQVIFTGTPTNAQHYVNGVIWNSSHPIWNGGILPVGTQFNIAYATDSLTSSTTSMYFGVGCSSAIAGSATFSNPRWTMWKGSETVPYYPNTSATNNSTADRYKSADYQAPRFEYDPSTLQTRGLLIEGSANNLLCLSESFATSGGTTNWAYNGNSGAVTSEVNPAGVASSFQFRETATGGGLLHQPVTPALPAGGQTYTFSIWMRGSVYSSVTTTQAQIGIQVGGTFQTVTPRIVGGYAASISGTTICTVSGLSTTQWTRVEIATTASIAASTTVNVFVWPNTTSYENNASVLLWGAQFEAGSGASSYIPTGASTGSRAFDSCVMEDITSLQYSTKTGTMFYAGRFTQMNAASFPNRVGFTRETGDFRTFAALSTTTSLLPCFANSGTTVLTTQNITLNSELKLAFSFDADLSTAEVKSSLNGGAIVQSGASALTESSVPTYFMLGQKGYGAFFPHGTVRSVKYWPSVLPTAQLQALTT